MPKNRKKPTKCLERPQKSKIKREKPAEKPQNPYFSSFLGGLSSFKSFFS